MLASTIAAISTPPGSGGIGIIKISGPKAIELAQSIFMPGPYSSANASDFNDSGGNNKLVSRRVYYGHIINPATRQVLDEVLFVVMRAPYSYTAEDVVEIQAHAGLLVLKSILVLLVEKGVSLAEPGEFTKRAFLNGRIDLTQAEAVMDAINAKSQKAIEIAVAQISGELKHIIQSLRTDVLNILSAVEARIDFSEDVTDDIDSNELAGALEFNIIPVFSNLILRYEEEKFLRDGLRAVIVGGPNVGKSSLLNCLVNRERAIVSEFAGTTRDFIEDSFVSKGIPIIVTDTAGIHEDPDPIERIGIEKAWELIREADIILYVVDAGKSASPEDLHTFNKISKKKVIIVVNKTDLHSDELLFLLPAEWQDVHHVEISARYNHGINELKEIVARLSEDFTQNNEQTIVPNLRHKLALEKGLTVTKSAVSGLRQGVPLEIVAIDLKTSLDLLDEITGESFKTDVLEQIFNRFCIGK